MRALLPCSPATQGSQGAGARTAGRGSEEGFGVWVFLGAPQSQQDLGFVPGLPRWVSI